MKRKRRTKIGLLVKNLTTGEIGRVMAVIGKDHDPFGYIVKTKSGIKRWILRKEDKKTSSELS